MFAIMGMEHVLLLIIAFAMKDGKVMNAKFQTVKLRAIITNNAYSKTDK